MNLICKHCGTEFPAQRATAQFCGESCKKKWGRANLPKLLEGAEQARERCSEREVKSDPICVAGPSLGIPQADGSFVAGADLVEVFQGTVEQAVGILHTTGPFDTSKVKDSIYAKMNEADKPLTTGENTIPVSDTQNWKRPNYWLRLRDLSPEEAKAFHSWLKETGRACPTDPTLPTGEQDFFHPWAYSEFKNSPLDAQPNTIPKELLQIPPGLPLNDGSAECMHERMKRVKSYNSTMPPKHCLTESKLRSLLTRAGYSPSLAKLAFPKS